MTRCSLTRIEGLLLVRAADAGIESFYASFLISPSISMLSAARVIHYAWQSESSDPRSGQPDLFPDYWLRCCHRDGCRSQRAGTEHGRTGDGLRPAARLNAVKKRLYYSDQLLYCGHSSQPG